MKFTIYGRLDGMNEYVKANRENRYAGAQMKKSNENIVLKALMGVKKEVFTKPVYIRFNWVEPNKRRDKDNISSGGRKAILDAIVRAGIIPNDGWSNVIGFSDSFDVDKNNPRIEVEIITEDELRARKERFLRKVKEKGQL